MNTYELPTFLGETAPVELVAELLDYSVDAHSLTLRCATKRYALERHNYYGTVCETTFAPPEPGEPATVRLDFCTDAIMRLRYAPGPAVPELRTPMVVGRFDGPAAFAVIADERAVMVQTAALRVLVIREPWQIEVYGADGALVWTTRPIDIAPLRRPEHQWNPPEQRWIFYHRYAYPLGVARGGRQRVSRRGICATTSASTALARTTGGSTSVARSSGCGSRRCSATPRRARTNRRPSS
jgi:hypothetical protein